MMVIGGYIMKLVLAAVLGLSAGAVQAGGPVTAAAEPEVAAPAAATEGWDWTGFYAGVSVTSGNVAGGGPEFNTDGFGLHAGYLHDLGTFVIGGELEYTDSDLDTATPTSITASRLKLIGGYGAGRFLPFVFVGLSDVKLNGVSLSVSDTVTNYGLGGRYALGANGRFVVGLEYIVEDKSNFAGVGLDLDRDEFALRIDYRF